MQTLRLVAIDLQSILKKNMNRTMFSFILKNFRMWTMTIEPPKPLIEPRVKMYKNIARLRLLYVLKSDFHCAEYSARNDFAQPSDWLEEGDVA